MNPLNAFTSFFSREFLLLVLSLPIAVGVGFALGVLYERWYQATALQKLSQRFEKLFGYVTQILTKAEKASQILAQQSAKTPLTSAQQSELKRLYHQLSTPLTQLFEQANKTTPSVSSPSPRPRSWIPRLHRKTFHPPAWVTQPRDERTGLPDATAYEHNFQALLKAQKGTSAWCGALFVQLDQYDRHGQRWGTAVANHFLRETAQLVQQQLTSHDLLCQLTDDLLIALIPDPQKTELEKRAQKIRQLIRDHTYRNSETAEEVFVTASFGFCRFQSNWQDTTNAQAELWERCQLALRTSQRNGRCQLCEVTPAGASRLIAG